MLLLNRVGPRSAAKTLPEADLDFDQHREAQQAWGVHVTSGRSLSQNDGPRDFVGMLYRDPPRLLFLSQTPSSLRGSFVGIEKDSCFARASKPPEFLALGKIFLQLRCIATAVQTGASVPPPESAASAGTRY